MPNLGDRSAKKLLHFIGSAEAIFKEKKSTLLKIEGIGALKLKDLSLKTHLEAAEEELQFINDNKISFFYFQDNLYPEKLKHCLDGPILIFQKGNVDLQKKRIISIIGTRNITNHGIRFCEKLIDELSFYNPVIISGFAYGADITAHKSAIKNNLQTVACLAHGLNQVYPKIHLKYQKQVEENGGFITDFWSSDTFNRNNFLKRNRIIAGLSEATVVIESAEKGGSLVTADIANSYNREVFAVPGRPTDLASIGCNNLIKTQQAHILTSAADLIYLLDWSVDNKKPSVIQKQLFVELTEDENVLFNFLKNNKKEQLDLIALHCKMPIHKVASLLLTMELKGVIRPFPGKLFEIV